MNKIFSFDRFSKYFVYDLNNAKNTFGISLLISGCLSIIICVFSNFYSLVFSQQLEGMHVAMSITALIAGFAIISIVSPIKIYGGITDKRMGSDWLLIPASTFEKFLSMLIILCVVIPVIFCILFLACDYFLALICKDYNPILTWASSTFGSLSELIDSEDGPSFTNAIYLAPWLNYMEIVLPFALGALCFKKAKVGKTIFVLWLLSCVFSAILATAIFQVGDFEQIINSFDPSKAELWVNLIINVIYIVVIGCLMGGIYYRLKTIKH
ncbi:MAG: hypothetical protein MJY83_00410 [Bacteroidales bacterium]|nr:hypothetical protein [Bacteroidales bacterium]